MSDFTKALSAIFIGLGVGFTTVAGVHTVVAHLEQDTLRQCRDEAWPADKHMAMATFCREFRLSMERYGRY